MSGLSRTPGKRVWVYSPPRVRIPPSPPNTKPSLVDGFLFFAPVARHLKRKVRIKAPILHL